MRYMNEWDIERAGCGSHRTSTNGPICCGSIHGTSNGLIYNRVVADTGLVCPYIEAYWDRNRTARMITAIRCDGRDGADHWYTVRSHHVVDVTNGYLSAVQDGRGAVIVSGNTVQITP